MVSAKMRHRPCTTRRPMPVAGGRSQTVTLARVNGSSSSQNARAAAPAVRLPQRYASRRAPPGPSVAPYSRAGPEEAGLVVARHLDDQRPVEHVLGRRAGDAVHPQLDRW